MKKYLSYILILIALVGIFSFVNLTQAVDSGTCYYKSVQDKVVINSNWTHQKCIDTAVADNGNLLDWIPDGTSNLVGSCVGATPDTPRTFHFDCLSKGGTWTEEAPNQPVATCYDAQGYNFGQKTHAQCQPPLIWRCTGKDSSGADIPAGCTPATAGGAGATNSTGDCTITDDKGVVQVQQSGVTKTDCDTVFNDAGGTGKGYTEKWTQTGGTASKIYNLLAPLPCTGDATTGCNGGMMSTYDPTGAGGGALGAYLNLIIKLFIGICAVLAVIMIVMGGIEYMTTELISSKEAGKERIRNAIFGLLLALGAWTLLNTINPDLLNTDLSSLTNVTVTIQPLYDRGATDPKQANGESTRCTPVLSGPCSVANLTPIFGDKAVAMSKICNMESGGGGGPSGTDICKPNNDAFSFGLFQVNLAANGSLAGADCVGLFDKKVSGADAISPKYTSGFSCSLLSGKETLYNTCKAKLLDSNTNLAIAKSLFSNSSGINNWVGDKRYCASAFN